MRGGKMTLTKEMLNKAEWVASLMNEDGVKADMINDELIMAYMDTIGRKIESIQTTCLTNSAAKDAMQRTVLGLL